MINEILFDDDKHMIDRCLNWLEKNVDVNQAFNRYIVIDRNNNPPVLTRESQALFGVRTNIFHDDTNFRDIIYLSSPEEV